jgi:hypothetical protein
MARDRFPKPHNFTTIEGLTERLRDHLGLGNQSYINVIHIVENQLPEFLSDLILDVQAQSDLGPIEAFTEYDPLRIVVREDIYEASWRDDARSRFSIAHELGHLCLHWRHPLARLSPSAQKFHDSRANARLEREANHFAAAFLMPRTLARRVNEPRLLARLCRVSNEAASRRLNEIWTHGDGLTTKSVRTLFGKNRPEK